MKIINQKDQGVPVSTMKDGDIAIIVQWGPGKNHIGKIIQRYRDILIVLGKDSVHAFTTALNIDEPEMVEKFRVEILQPGTQLEL